MVRFCGPIVAAALAACPVPAMALVYTNAIAVDDVTLNIRIETDGTLGLIGLENLVSFDGSVTDRDGNIFNFVTGYYFDDPFNANISYGPYLASPTAFNLNGNYLATTFIIKSDGTYEVLGIGDSDLDPNFDGDMTSEIYLTWSSGGVQQTRRATVPTSQFDQNIAFAEAASAVPEPSTWAMLLIGFGVVGSAARRRVSRRIAFA